MQKNLLHEYQQQKIFEGLCRSINQPGRSAGLYTFLVDAETVE